MRGSILTILLLGGFVSALPAQQSTPGVPTSAPTPTVTTPTPQHPPNFHMGPGGHFDPGAMLEQVSEQIVESPGDPQGYVRRARIYMMLGQYDEAIEDSSQAIQISPNLLPAYFQMARAYKMDGAYDQAIATYNKVLDLNPRLADAYVNRGQAYKLAGDAKGNADDYEQAIADYRTAIDMNGNYASAYNDLAWLEATCPNATYRNVKDAIINAQRACQLTRYHGRAQLDTLAAAYANAGDYTNAVKTETTLLAMASRWHMPPQFNSPLLKEWKDRLALYQSHKPLRLAGDSAPAITFGTTVW